MLAALQISGGADKFEGFVILSQEAAVDQQKIPAVDVDQLISRGIEACEQIHRTGEQRWLIDLDRQYFERNFVTDRRFEHVELSAFDIDLQVVDRAMAQLFHGAP